MQKKVLITSGGTGGHIFPAIALAQQLKEEAEILFAGGNLSNNRYFQDVPFHHEDICCAKMASKNPIKLIVGFVRILIGFFQSRSIIKKFQPDVIVGFGSYYTVPMLLAARWMRIPIVLHESNSIPGKVNSMFAQYAQAIGIQFPAASQYLKGNTVEVGMPLREGYKQGTYAKEAAREHFRLDPHAATILFFGGSQGARVLNTLVADAISYLSGVNPEIQIIHIAGTPESAHELISRYKRIGVRACVKDFETRIDIAWQAADMVICRAGAGTIAEELEFEVPGILIPWPKSADNHQEKNAEFMVKTVGGAVMFNEKKIHPGLLAGAIASQLQILPSMVEAMRAYKTRSRTIDLAALVLNLNKAE